MNLEKWLCEEKKATFLGTRMQQCRLDLLLWEDFFNECGEIKMVVELGTGNGAFSIFLFLQAIQRGANFRTFDILGYPGSPVSSVIGLASHFRQGDIFTGEAKEEIVRLLEDDCNHPLVLFCDNGNKKVELETFFPYLRLGDFVVVHDWGKEIKPIHLEAYDSRLEGVLSEQCEEFGSLTRFWKVIPDAAALPEDTAVIILAGGTDANWNYHTPRHLVPIAGEPLTLRTLRQLEELGYEGIVVTHREELLDLLPLENVFRLDNQKWIVETMLRTKELWKEKTIILPGDVVWEDRLFHIALRSDIFPRAYGNAKEIFALTFLREHWERVEDALQRVSGIFNTSEVKGYCALWHYYYAFHNLEPIIPGQRNDKYGPAENWRTIASWRATPRKGYTADFDRPWTYGEWMQDNPWAYSGEGIVVRAPPDPKPVPEPEPTPEPKPEYMPVAIPVIEVNSPPIIKAVITTLDNLTILEEQISILKSDPLVNGIIVVNNGSRDGTKKYLDSLGPEITRIHRENNGAGPGRNAGIDAVGDFDFVHLIDGGIRPLHGGVAGMLRYLQRNPEIDVISPEIATCFTTDKDMASRRFSQIGRTFPQKALSSTAYALCRKKAFDGIRFCEVGPFSQAGWGVDDNEMACRWNAAGIVHYDFTGVKLKLYRRQSGSFRRLYEETGIWPNQYGSVFEARLVLCAQMWPQYVDPTWNKTNLQYSFVIAAHNEYPEVVHLIKKLHNDHKATPHEIILVDNASTDETGWWLDTWALRWPHGDTTIDARTGEILRRHERDDLKAVWTGNVIRVDLDERVPLDEARELGRARASGKEVKFIDT